MVSRPRQTGRSGEQSAGSLHVPRKLPRQQPGIEPAKRPDHYLNNLVRMLDKEMRATALPLLAARRVFVFGKLLGR